MDITGVIPLDDNLSAKLYRTPEESILYCESKGKKIKETSIVNKARASFENKLNLIIEGLAKKYTSKNYDKIHVWTNAILKKFIHCSFR